MSYFASDFGFERPDYSEDSKLTRALLVVRNPAAYPEWKRRASAIYVLGNLGASEEDILAASALA